MKARVDECPFFLPGLEFSDKLLEVADGAIHVFRAKDATSRL